MTDLHWNEQNSQTFIDRGRYFVPRREQQMGTVCALLPAQPAGSQVLELCCGEGLLAELVLGNYPRCQLTGLDGSPAMLDRARQRLARFGERFQGQLFELEEHNWRAGFNGLAGVISSLAVHHLDGAGKQRLYRDVFQMLAPGGALVIADVIAPAGPSGNTLAAQAWDEAVYQRCLEIDGHAGRFTEFQELEWNLYRYPDPMDKPSPIYDQLAWLIEAGFSQADVYWLYAGHAIFGGVKPQD
jgi:tRNA (cmo5U34)-methyltransferase